MSFVREQFDSPLGQMIAIADSKHLHLLEFIDRKHLDKNLLRFKGIKEGDSPIIALLKDEIDAYFHGVLSRFNVPICCFGTAFQKRVYDELLKIPCGQTRSYEELAISINRPTAYRAVALANASNQIAIIVPCHRVINKGGGLGGYAGGLSKKKKLIEHESLSNSFCLGQQLSGMLQNDLG